KVCCIGAVGCQRVSRRHTLGNGCNVANLYIGIVAAKEACAVVLRNDELSGKSDLRLTELISIRSICGPSVNLTIALDDVCEDTPFQYAGRSRNDQLPGIAAYRVAILPARCRSAAIEWASPYSSDAPTVIFNNETLAETDKGHVGASIVDVVEATI